MTFRRLVLVKLFSDFFPVFVPCFDKGFLPTSLWKQVLVLTLAKSTSHWIFFNIIVQPWVLFKPMVLKGTLLFAINCSRELKRLRWLVWLTIHGYFRHAVTTSPLGLFNRTMVILLLQLFTWFEEKANFFLFCARHFKLFTNANQRPIRWL